VLKLCFGKELITCPGVDELLGLNRPFSWSSFPVSFLDLKKKGHEAVRAECILIEITYHCRTLLSAFVEQ